MPLSVTDLPFHSLEPRMKICTLMPVQVWNRSTGLHEVTVEV